MVTHHSVMCELLPCPLRPSGVELDHNNNNKHEDDFADLDLLDYPDLMFTLRKTFGSDGVAKEKESCCESEAFESCSTASSV